jgi:hypothetical protein
MPGIRHGREAVGVARRAGGIEIHGGTLVLPAEGAVVDLIHDHARVGALVVVPHPDRPILRTTRLAIATAAHTLASC